MTKLYHPELDRFIDVSESAARVHRKKGWVDPDDPSPAFDTTNSFAYQGNESDTAGAETGSIEQEES